MLPLYAVCLSQLKPSAQPQTIEVVGYQRVLNALPNGAPDPKAPDNFYVKITSHYVLAIDSDRFEPDSKGTRHVVTPRRDWVGLEGWEQSGRETPKMRDAFREVQLPESRSQYRLHKNSWGTSGRLEQDVPSCGRLLTFHRQTIVEAVEIHTDGRRRSRRVHHTEFFGSTTTMVGKDQIFDPSKDKVYWSDSSPEVRVDPVLYGYVPQDKF